MNIHVQIIVIKGKVMEKKKKSRKKNSEEKEINNEI